MQILKIVPAVVCILAFPLRAQDNAELLKRIQAMDERIKSLEAQVADLKGQQAALTAAVQSAPAAPAAPVAPAAPGALAPETMAGQGPVTAPPQLGGAGAAAAKVLNPDISVIGDFVGGIGNPANRYVPSLEMHESEVGFQEVIDPYARADFFLTFGEEGVSVEEGYLTFTALPAGLQIKVGKMRSAFGKVNTMHNHVLPWVDRPLANQDLVGGEDGIDDAGLSLSRILPAPKGIFLEGTAQLYRGDTEGVFRANKRSDLSTVEHLRLYHDINDDTNIDLGGSFARGRSPFGNGWNQLYGLDATLRWKPLRRSIYHSFVARSEWYFARTVVSPELAPFARPNGVVTPYGFYISSEYQPRRRWFLGARFDRSQRGECLPTNPLTSPLDPASCNAPPAGLPRLLTDTGGSLLVTYWPSEFSQIRGQLKRTHYGEGLTANELLFQFIFSMGAHGAHPF